MSRGGYRCGRRRFSVDDCHSLSAWGRFERSSARYDEDFWCEWYRDEEGEAHLHSVDPASRELLLTLRSTRGEAEHTHHIFLTPIPCHYGGVRYWFLCPCCGRRAGKLYVPADGRSLRWGCRHCYHLTYEQRRAGCDSEYLSWRADRLLDRNGITLEDGSFHKPKGMRYKTFHQLTDRRNALIDRANSLFLSSFFSGMPSKYRRGLFRSLKALGSASGVRGS